MVEWAFAELTKNQKSLTKAYAVVYKEYDLNLIGGYYTLNTSVYNKNERDEIKIIQIKKFEIDAKVIGMEVSLLLVIHALIKIYKMTLDLEEIFAIQIKLEPIYKMDFFKECGFKTLKKNNEYMYLSFKQLKKLFSPL